MNLPERPRPISAIARKLLSFLAAASISTSLSQAAIIPALGEPMGAATRTDAYQSTGYGFYTPTSGTTINRIGYWDQAGDGLAVSHDVMLVKYNGSGYTQVVRVTIPAGTTARLEGGYRWVNIADTVLPNIGQSADYYGIVASQGTDPWTNGVGNAVPMTASLGTKMNAFLNNNNTAMDAATLTVIGGNPGWGGANFGYEPPSVAPPTNGTRVKIMPLGDSITAGYTDNSAWNEPFEFGYRGPLANLLTNAGYPFRFVGGSPEPFSNTSGDPTKGGTVYPVNELRDPGVNQGAHRGYGGYSIAQINSNAAAWIAADDPDVILLHIGTNGIGAGSPADLNTLVSTIFTAKPTVKLVVAQIIPSVSYNANVVNYNDYIGNTLVPFYQTAGRNISTVNQYPNFLTNPADNTSINTAKFSNAINHPTNAAYQLMAATWLPAVSPITLGNSSISATTTQGSTITSLSRLGGSGGETFTYSLVSGSGATDNGSFSISGGNLVAGNRRFDLDPSGATYSIRVKATGSVSGDIEQILWLKRAPGAANPLAVSIQTFSNASETAYSADVKNNDLLQGLAGTHLNYNSLAGAPGQQLTNGLHGIAGETGAVAWAGDGNITSSTYELGPGTGAGFDITRITSIAAWTNVGFMNQKYKISVRYSGAVEYTTATDCLVDFQPITNMSAAGATKVVITRPGGLLFHGIEAIRFTFLDTNSSNNGGVTMREIDVEGTAIPTGSVRVMPLGDSITYGMGAGAAMIPGGYRDPLAKAYTAAARSFRFVGSDTGNTTTYLVANNQQANEGHTGYRIDQIQTPLNSWLASARPDVVLVHLGTNDILQNYNLGTGVGNDTSSAIGRLSTLISTLYAGNPSMKVVLSTLIPIQDARDLYVKNYNAALPSVVASFTGQGRSIVLVDNYANFVNSDGSWKTGSFADYAHPNLTGYTAMAATFAGIPLPLVDGITFTPATAPSAMGLDSNVAPNLVRAGSSTLASMTAPTGSLSGTFPVTGLNDGSAAGNPNYTYYSVNDASGGATPMPATVTFDLNTSANTAGYDISSVQAISGWGDHNLGAQSFQLLLSVNREEFVNYGTYTNAAYVNGGNASFLTTVGHTTGMLARNVTGVRFVFLNPDPSGGATVTGSTQAVSNGGTVIHELQVFGTASPILPPSPFVLTKQTAAGANGSDSAIAVNLLRTGQSSLGSVTVPPGAGVFPTTGVNDGSAASNANYTFYSVTDTNGGATPLPVTLTFNLNTTVNTKGYDISSVQAISGWGDHSLGAQRFQLLLSRAGGAFEDYGTYRNADIVNGGNSSFLSTITRVSGPLATNVTAVRFIFQNPDKSNGAGSVGTSQAGGGSTGGTVIRELQAFGTPSTGSLAYNNWASGTYNLSGSSALPGADPDSDGFTNLQEFAFGTDPTVTSSGPITYAGGVISSNGQPTTSIANIPNGVDFRAVFGRRKDYLAAGLTYTVQFSAGLNVWVNRTDTPTVVASDATMDAVTVPYPLFIPTANGMEKPTFFRVAVSSN